MRDYLYAGGEGPVPLEALQNQKYRDIVSIRLYYDWHTCVSDFLPSDILLTDNARENRDALMEEYVRLMQNMLRSTSTIKKRAKSVYHSKNLGTIKNRKKEKQQTAKEDSNGEIILRILRMRYLFWAEVCVIGLIRPNRNGTSDFIIQQLRTLSKLQAEQEAREKAKEQRKLNRPRQDGQVGGIPPVSPVPPVPPVPSK